MRYFILFFLFFSALFSSETALIASFNTLKLGESRKDYYQLSKILSKFDLIGLQEVMNERGLKILKQNLESFNKGKWEYHISEYSVGNGEYKEYYAFIWRKDKVSLERVLGFYNEINKNDFSREPYAAKFRIGNFDFIFILAHSIFGKRERERILEAARYVLVYEYFFNLDPLEDDVILAGDFNIPANSMGFRKLLRHENQIEYILDPKKDLSTLGKNSLASSYDNFFLSKKYTTEFTGRYGVYNYIKNNYKDIKKYISDHLPIFIEVAI